MLLSPWLEPIARPLRLPLLLLFAAFTLTVPPSVTPSNVSDWLTALGAEFFLGMLLAISFALPFYSFRWVGDLTESLRGAPRSQLPGMQADSALSFFFHLATLAIFAGMGGFVLLLDALHDFSIQYPLGSNWLNEAAPIEGSFHLLGDAFTLMVRVAAPIMAAALMLEVVLALIARTAPQIPVFFLALPIRSLTVISVAAIGLGTTLMLAADAIGAALVVN